MAILCVTPGYAQTDIDALAKVLAEFQSMYAAGRYTEAAPLADKLIELNAAAHGTASKPYAIALYTKGNLLSGIDRYREAEEALRKAVSIFSQQPESQQEVAQTNTMLASVLVMAGKVDEGIPLMRRSVEEMEGLLGIDDQRVLVSLNNLGQTLQFAGRSGEAVTVYRRLIERTDAASPANFESTGILYANLAAALQEIGQRDEARQALQTGVELLRKLNLADHPRLATALNNLGYLHHSSGQLDAAQAHYRDALGIIARTSGEDSAAYATGLINLAVLAKDQGKLEESESLTRRAYAILETSLGIENPRTTSALGDLAVLAAARNDWASALALNDQVTERSLRYQKARSRSGAEKGSSVYALAAGNLPAHIRAIHRVAPTDAARREQAFQLFQRTQDTKTAAALTQMAARIAAGDNELARLVRTQQDLKQEYLETDKRVIAVLGGGPDAVGQRSALQGELRRLEQQLSRIGSELQQRFPEYGALIGGEPVASAEVQKLLAADEILFGFLEVPALHQYPPELFVFALTSESFHWHQLSGEYSQYGWGVPLLRCGLDEASWQTAQGRQWCSQATAVAPDKVPRDGGAPLPFRLDVAHAIYQALFQPFEHLMRRPDGTWRHLLVVAMQGPLSRLPLQVLVTAKPDHDMLLEPAQSDKSVAWLGTRQPITILPSIASLKALRGQAKASRASKPYLGFGNPLLTGGDGSDRSAWTHQRCTPALLQQVARASVRGIMRNATSVVRAGVVDTERLRRQPPLPETAEELCAVAAALGAEPSAVRLGEEATEARLKSLSDSGELQQARIIHIATHGMVSGETQWFAASKTEPALVLTPPAQPSGIDDGLLTASEVATLKLDADWVILSACNTAADDGSGAEALSGLARAFFYAGARSLAVSHWRVDSDATVQLITGALQALAAEPRIGRAEAMRRAMARQIAAGGHWAHPANWSLFVLAGEGSAGR